MNIRNPIIIGGAPSAPQPRYTKEFDPGVGMWVLAENGKPLGYLFSEIVVSAIILALEFRRRALSLLPDLVVPRGSMSIN